MRRLLYIVVYTLCLHLNNGVGLAILVATILLQLNDKTEGC